MSVQRKIIHCDADCFFAAIEMRDDPNLRNRPLAVGGSAERRGVIATCNYDARRFGVRSAMSTAHALRLCPDLLVVPPNMDKYIHASREMRNIFYDYTDLIEPLSLDEAFLDVSECHRLKGSATLIAEEIRQRIYEKLQITVSAGVANSKFLSKIASDLNKPDGIFVIPPKNVEKFIKTLPIGKIFGVGKVTQAKMHNMHIQNCEDLAKLSIFELVEHFGSHGKQLYELCRGIDLREVTPKRQRKSLSVEHTFADDLTNTDACLAKVPGLFLQLHSRLRRMNTWQRITKVFAKVKFTDFSSTSIEKTGLSPSKENYEALVREACERKNLAVRLLGLGIRFVDEKEEDEAIQLELFEKFPELLLERQKN